MIKYTKSQLTGYNLAKLVDHSAGDADLAEIVKALRFYRMHVPANLLQ